jgi:hypothetical protein
MKYDLTIAHRVCPGLSKTVFGFMDKESLIRETTKTLAFALAGIRVRLVVILDGCSTYRQIFEEAFSARRNDDCFALEFIETPAIGNMATWAKQLQILSVANSPFVYFSEDDYLYAEDAFRAMLDFAERPGVDFVTPLDHPDRYNSSCGRSVRQMVEASPFGHWVTTGTTCLTFLAKKDVLDRTCEAMASYSRLGEECTMWLGLTKERVFNLSYLVATFIHFLLRRQVTFGQLMPLCTWRRKGLKLLTHSRFMLWSPIPTLAVHLSTASLPLNSEKFFPDQLKAKAREAILSYLSGK